MIKRTLYFGNKTYLHLKNKQLIIEYDDNETKTVPIEDIGFIVLDHYQITISHTLISNLLFNNVAVITTNDKHMPQGMILNLDGNSIQGERFTSQLNASLPLKKQLWQQTVQSKIKNQARLLDEQSNVRTNIMYHLADSTLSGDIQNNEGQAAAYYWKHLFGDDVDVFKRGRFEDIPNNLLNYGYAILRAVIARSLVGSGLLPAQGIHHHNRYNSYPLADDIMEPYRPFVDDIVLDIMDRFDDYSELTTEIKTELLQIPVIDIEIDKKKRPLMHATQITSASLVECFAGTRKRIKYPVL